MCTPTSTLAPNAPYCSPWLKSERTYRIILAGGGSLGYLTHHSSDTLDESFYHSKHSRLSNKNESSSPVVLRVLSGSALSTNLAHSQVLPQIYWTRKVWGGAQQICFNTQHASDKVWQPLLHTSSNLLHPAASSTLTMNCCPGFLLLRGKKIKNQANRPCVDLNQQNHRPPSVAAICPALPMTFLQLVPPLAHLDYSCTSLH